MSVDLEALEALLAKMSPRPWSRMDGAYPDEIFDPTGKMAVWSAGDRLSWRLHWAHGNRDGVVELVNAAADLIARIRELEAALGDVIEAMRQWGSYEDGVPEAGAGEYGSIGRAYDRAKSILAAMAEPKKEGDTLVTAVRGAEQRELAALEELDEANAEVRELRALLSDARATARILAHAYQHDSRPPEDVVATAIGYPAKEMT